MFFSLWLQPDVPGPQPPAGFLGGSVGRGCHQPGPQVPGDGSQVPYSTATVLGAQLQESGEVMKYRQIHTPTVKGT